MKTKAEKIDTFAEVMNLANKLINYEWNCRSRSGNATKIIRLLGKDWLDVDNMRNFLVGEQKRMKNKYDFDQYYGATIIDTLDELIAAAHLHKKTVGELGTPENGIIGHAIQTAIKNNFTYNEFNWKNYDILKANDMLDVISEFNTYFRGDVTKVHKVYNDKFIVIETSRHPFDYDKQRTKFKEPAETNFYSFNKDDKEVYRHNSSVYNTFEDALVSVMCPQFSSAISALIQISKEK